MHPSLLLILFFFVPLTVGINVCPTREITLSSGRITSPNYPNKYPANADCTLTIKQPLDTNFTFTFTKINMEGDEDDALSCFDSLKISGIKSKDFCGSRPPPPFSPGLNVVKLHMKSDDTQQETGFDLTFSSVKITGLPQAVDVCPTREIIPSATGRVHSPKYADNYDNNLNCKLTLKVPSNKAVEYTFNDFFDLGPIGGQSCSKDKIVIGDKSRKQTVCGTAVPQVKGLLENGDVNIHFTTDASVTRAGFIMTYKLVDKKVPSCVCPDGNQYIIRVITKNNIIKRLNDDISVEFKTTKADGLILFAKGGLRDFILLKLQNGLIVFEADLGTGNLTVTVPTANLNNNEWHTVKVERRGKAVAVSVGESATVYANTPRIFTHLDIKPQNGLPAAMYVLGGPSGIRFSTNFQGCVRNLTIDEMKPIELQQQNDPNYTLYGRSALASC